jgi:hypothetical protein
MPKTSEDNNRGNTRTDRNGVVRRGATIFIPEDKVEKALLLRGRIKRSDGTECFTLKSIYEALIEKALK